MEGLRDRNRYAEAEGRREGEAREISFFLFLFSVWGLGTGTVSHNRLLGGG